MTRGAYIGLVADLGHRKALISTDIAAADGAGGVRLEEERADHHVCMLSSAASNVSCSGVLSRPDSGTIGKTQRRETCLHASYFVCGFMPSAVDAAQLGGGEADTFRIRFWEQASGEVIHDTWMGVADAADPTTAIGGRHRRA